MIPHEFTRVDGIIDLVFAAAEEVRQAEAEPAPADAESNDGAKPDIARFNDACIKRIEAHLHLDLLRRTQVTFAPPDERTVVICAVSREHHDSAEGNFWFAFHPHQKELISNAETGFVAFGCGSPSLIVMVPAAIFLTWLDGMNVTSRPERSYWHISIFREGGHLTLHRRRGFPIIDLTDYTLPGSTETQAGATSRSI